jgi:hypothetical protein
MALYMKAAGGLKLRHLPTNGGGPALTSLLGNNSQALVSSVSACLAQIKGGKAKPLVLFGAKRSKALPDVPTMQELGYNIEYYLWVGMFAPKGMFWGFVASMYVGNLMLLALNLPLVGVFVTVLRIPYAYLYPLIIMFCIVGVYEVSHSIVDVWIMLIMGVLGYALRKFSFDPAPLVLGLVISPLFGAEPAPVAHHVERRLHDLHPAADLGGPARRLHCAARAFGTFAGHEAARLARQARGSRGRRAEHLSVCHRRYPLPPGQARTIIKKTRSGGSHGNTAQNGRQPRRHDEARGPLQGPQRFRRRPAR